jgi:hypothetical protein
METLTQTQTRGAQAVEESRRISSRCPYDRVMAESLL